MSTAPAIEATGLTKRFGDVAAVSDVDLRVEPGEVYAFLGRNGGGKTTTIRMLLGLARPTRGRVRLLGRDLARDRSPLARVGHLVESATAHPRLSVRENLRVHARLTGSPGRAVDDAIEQLGLAPYADRPARHLSLGNAQRLSLARALLHRPDVLVLDEPANALDPAGIAEVRTLLRSLAHDEGVAVFLSSHLLSEVARLADRVGIVRDGALVEETGRADLAARARAHADAALTEQQRDEAILLADLERYVLWRTAQAPGCHTREI